MQKRTKQKSRVVLPVGIIQNKIYLIRGQKVMLDRDLAELYGVLTKNLNKAVKRNKERFPEEFCFTVTKEEFQNLKFQFGTSSWGGMRYLPFVFTEHGVLMLSSVLNSSRAIQVNIQIMRVFVKLKEMMTSHKDLARKIEDIERQFQGRFNEQDKKIALVFNAIKELLSDKEEAKKKRGPMGFVAYKK